MCKIVYNNRTKAASDVYVELFTKTFQCGYSSLKIGRFACAMVKDTTFMKDMHRKHDISQNSASGLGLLLALVLVGRFHLADFSYKFEKASLVVDLGFSGGLEEGAAP